jgi:photosystem II stability/assembly factor-like uncharacterized protein
MKARVLKYFSIIFIFLLSVCIFAQRSRPESEQDKDEGPNSIIKYFQMWHYPYGNILPEEKQQEIYNELEKMPKETERRGENGINSWECLGPYGLQTYGVQSQQLFSGRVLDIETDNQQTGVLVASASGGLWGYALALLPYCLTDNINSLVIGSFDSKKNNGNTIIIGTGEPGVRGGDGIYRTTNKGATWVKETIVGGDPYGVYKLRYYGASYNNYNTLFAATTSGVYRSDDDGVTWHLKFYGNCTDICYAGLFAGAQNIYTAKWGDGIYKSTDYGDTWTRVTSAGLPQENIGRVAISSMTSLSNYETYIYTCIVNNDSNKTLGVYKSSDGGNNFTNITPPGGDFHWGQGWYNNTIAVSPNDPNLVLVGGCLLHRTSDGGNTWQLNLGQYGELHADFHAITWGAGQLVYVGHDGGLSTSQDAGITWNTIINNLPLTQYVNFDVTQQNPNYIFGGSQDNGISGTTDSGTSWDQYIGGDGGGVSINPGNPLNVFVTCGDFFNSGILFRRFSTTDAGQNWLDINSGILNSGQWYTKIRSDGVAPPVLFSNCGPYVYQSNNSGIDWLGLNANAFAYELLNLDVSVSTSPHAVIYASLNANPPTSNQKLKVYETNTWDERSTGLPSYQNVRSVTSHPTNTLIAYACINGFSAGQKIFKTTDRGLTWTNITGDLPDIPISYVIPHPSLSNILFLGTEYGCFKTTNGGTNWIKWNNGMPEANIITEMKGISIAGRYYIYASSYGRGIWRRDITGEDPPPAINNISYFKNSLNKTIGGNQTIYDTIYAQTGQTGVQVSNLVIRIDTILFSNDKELQAYIMAPDGTTDTLFYQPGLEQGQNFIESWLEDNGSLNIEDGQSPFTGLYKPAIDFSRLDGTNPNGQWILQITSNSPEGASGVLNAWSMDISYSTITEVHNDENILRDYKLFQNYPNPFNPTTKISWQSPVGSWQTLKVYDILGREVETLVNEYKPAGKYEATFDGSNLASGVYFYRLEAGDFHQTAKMLLLK